MNGRNWRQADEPEIERVVPERVHLPANGHGLHLYRESCKKSGGEKTGKSRMTQGGEPPLGM